jgi:hypothetical protein
MQHRTLCLWIVTSVLAVAAWAGGGVLGLKSPDGTQGHAVTVHSSPEGGGIGEWTIRDAEDGCQNALLTITISGPPPLCITSCTAPAEYEYCCEAIEGWCMRFYREVTERVPVDEGPVEPDKSGDGG